MVRRQYQHFLSFIFLIVLFSIFSLPRVTTATDAPLPFSPGEKLTMQIKWGFIYAGDAVFEVLPIEEINGIKSYHFVMTVKTSPFIDIFYKVRDKFHSYTDIGMSHSILYKKHKRGKIIKDVLVSFNWNKNEAQHCNNDEKCKAIQILPGSFDPLSVFYAFRVLDFKKNAQFKRAVTDGKKCILGLAQVMKREKITVAGKIYDTYLVQPDLKDLEGVFEKEESTSLKIWITADKLKLPVRVKGKIIVGSFTGELVSATGSHISEY